MQSYYVLYCSTCQEVGGLEAQMQYSMHALDKLTISSMQIEFLFIYAIPVHLCILQAPSLQVLHYCTVQTYYAYCPPEHRTP